MTKTFDDAVKLGRIAFKQPFNEAYEVIGCGRRVKNALKWVNAYWHCV